MVTLVLLLIVDGLETGYSIDFFDVLGNTVVIVTLQMSCFRILSSVDRPTVMIPTAG
jgi:hypothetical protein